MTTFCVSPYPHVPTPMPAGWKPEDETKTMTKTPYPKEPKSNPEPDPDREYLKELDGMWESGRSSFRSDSDYISYLKEYVIQLRRANQNPETSAK